MIPEIVTAISAIKGLKDLAASSDNHQFVPIINDLYDSLITAREKIIDLQEENLRLRDQIRAQEDLKAFREDMECRGDFAFFKKSTGEGPFCKACFGGSDKAIRLSQKNEFWYECPLCKATCCTDTKAYQASIHRAMGTAPKTSSYYNF